MSASTTPIQTLMANNKLVISSQTYSIPSWADMVEAEEAENKTRSAIQNVNPKINSWSKVVGNIPESKGFDLSIEEQRCNNVKITIEI